MTERGTKTLIGAFVLGALALLATGVLLVGSGVLFRKNVEFVLFFDASLRGLVEGAPVYFKGVRVGKVLSVQISAGEGDQRFRTPVVIELENELLIGEGRGDEDNFMRDERVVQNLIRRGLRAKLGMQSFITGQLSVELDILPNARPVDPLTLSRFRGLQQIPTVPSSLEAMLDVLNRIPLEELATKFVAAVNAFSAQLDGLDLPGITGDIASLSREMRAQLTALPELRRDMQTALQNISQLARHADTGLSAGFRRVDTVLADILSLTRTARAVADSAKELLREDSAPMLELSQTMRTLREAASSLSDLATMLELQPDALIFGRR
ncbi:MAG: MCE family protein [Desulfovibrionaceae bacterium]|nr:MCE family protein [Desulfovibrionaceae bacterium]